MPKRVANPKARWLTKPKGKPTHKQCNYKASGINEEDRFSVYLRQNLYDPSDYSCGIIYIPRSSPSLTLARYNGSSHPHGDILYRPHIHRATAKAISAGKKPESEAKETQRYGTLSGALACLVKDFNISGLRTKYDEPRMFL